MTDLSREPGLFGLRCVGRGAFFASGHTGPVLGIDPGITGGIALLYPDATIVRAGIMAFDIPTAGGEVDVDALARRIKSHAPHVAVIERAGAMPKQGVSSTFKYGVAYGALRAVVAVLRIPQHLVTPGKWKNHFRLDSDKEKARALAIRLWPGCGLFERKKDHGRAEAALIARYGQEMLFRAPVGGGQQ